MKFLFICLLCFFSLSFCDYVFIDNIKMKKGNVFRFEPFISDNSISDKSNTSFSLQHTNEKYNEQSLIFHFSLLKSYSIDLCCDKDNNYTLKRCNSANKDPIDILFDETFKVTSTVETFNTSTPLTSSSLITPLFIFCDSEDNKEDTLSLTGYIYKASKLPSSLSLLYMGICVCITGYFVYQSTITTTIMILLISLTIKYVVMFLNERNHIREGFDDGMYSAIIYLSEIVVNVLIRIVFFLVSIGNDLNVAARLYKSKKINFYTKSKIFIFALMLCGYILVLTANSIFEYKYSISNLKKEFVILTSSLLQIINAMIWYGIYMRIKKKIEKQTTKASAIKGYFIKYRRVVTYYGISILIYIILQLLGDILFDFSICLYIKSGEIAMKEISIMIIVIGGVFLSVNNGLKQTKDGYICEMQDRNAHNSVIPTNEDKSQLTSI